MQITTKQIQEAKLLEALSFFTTSTNYCHQLKSYKLLYYLDMLHFRETGRTVTGQTYYAFPMGPVPLPLYTEVKTNTLSQEFSAQFSVQKTPRYQNPSTTQTTFIQKKPGTTIYLTYREQRIMKEIAQIFRDVNAEDMSDISHGKNGPWELAMKRKISSSNPKINFLDSVNLSIGSTQHSLSRDILKARQEEFKE